MALRFASAVLVFLGLLHFAAFGRNPDVPTKTCRIYRKQGNKWKALTPKSATKVLSQATLIRSIRPLKGERVTFEWKGISLATTQDCIKSETAPPPAIIHSQVQTAAHSEPKPAAKKSAAIALSLFNWHEPLSLTSGSDTYELSSSHFGFLFDWGMDWRLGHSWLWGFRGGAFFGMSEIAEETGGSTAPSLQYRLKGATVFGALVGPQIHYFFGKQDSQLGFWIPITARFSDWPNPTEGSKIYAVDPSPAVFLGLFADVQMPITEKSAITFSTGFTRSFKNLSWMLGTKLKI